MFDCLDCGIDTSRTNEYYMVEDELWLTANPDDFGMLCIGCLEKRLGRTLTGFDFTDAPVNNGWCVRSERMDDRLARLV